MGKFLGNAPLGKGLRDAFLGEIRCRNHQFVRDIPQHRLVQFLVVGAVQVALEVIAGQEESCPGNLVGLAVAGSHHVASACSGRPEQEGKNQRYGSNRHQQQPEQERSGKEGSLLAQPRGTGMDEPDILRQVADGAKLAQEIGETDYSYASELSALVDLEKYGTEEEKAAAPKVTGALLKRVFSYLLPYWKQFLLVLLLIAYSVVLT